MYTTQLSMPGQVGQMGGRVKTQKKGGKMDGNLINGRYETPIAEWGIRVNKEALAKFTSSVIPAKAGI
jgi:hypothetical protein